MPRPLDTVRAYTRPTADDRGYPRAVVPRIARRVSGNPEAYQYLAESSQAWPPPPALANQIRAAGWRQGDWQYLDGGIVVLHHAHT